MHVKNYKNRERVSMTYDYVAEDRNLNASTIGELDPAAPTGTQFIREGDNHLRAIKTAVKGSFPGIGNQPILADGININAIMNSYVYGKVEFWFGDPIAVPLGFVLCNGKRYDNVVVGYNGSDGSSLKANELFVPNFQDRFPYHDDSVSSEVDAEDRTGGDNDGVAEHTHEATSANDTHSHTYFRETELTVSSGGGNRGVKLEGSNVNTSEDTHNHTITVENTGIAGGNRPAFFVGVWIAYVGPEAIENAPEGGY